MKVLKSDKKYKYAIIFKSIRRDMKKFAILFILLTVISVC